MPATAAPASSSARMVTVEVSPPQSTAHTPAAVSTPRRWYSLTCQAPPVSGPAGISLAIPVEANTSPTTIRHRSRAPPIASNWSCAAVPPASDTICAAAAAPSQASRSPPRCPSAARTSLTTLGERAAATAMTPVASIHAQADRPRRAGGIRSCTLRLTVSSRRLWPVPDLVPMLMHPLSTWPVRTVPRWLLRSARLRPSTAHRPGAAEPGGACVAARAGR